MKIAAQTLEKEATAPWPALKTKIGEMLNRWPAVGMAVGVVRNGSLEFFHAHGLADIKSKTPITEDTGFRVASITKTFTAIAVMQLWERGLVDLDAPASDYLRAYRLLPTDQGWRPATVRHLLTHTSGVAEALHPTDALKPLFGEIVKLGKPLPPLSEYYAGTLRISAEPGTRFVYTDHGFATLGQIVEDVSGEALPGYFREHIFEALGMTHTDIVRSPSIESRLATGYTVGSRGARPAHDYEPITVGASSVYSTPRDMARYLAALMGGGSNEHGSVLKPATLSVMFEPQYQPDPRVPGIGLAFDRFNLGGHPAIAHEGVLPGFNSQFVVAPDDGLGVMAFTNGAPQAMLWLPAQTAGLLAQLLGLPADHLRTDVPQHPEIWPETIGWYPLDAAWTDWRLRMMLGLGVEVLSRRGQLVLRLLSPIPAAYRGFVLHPDDESDPYVFRVDLSQFGIGTTRVVFSRHPSTGTTAVQPDFMPLSLYRQPMVRSPKLWLRAAIGVAGSVSVAKALHARRRRAPAQEV